MSPFQNLSADEQVSEDDASSEKVGEISWKVRGQTTEKPNNDCFKTETEVVWRKNEDRFRITETDTTILAAVADGAGSSGMYCGAWAEALVKNLPETPITDIDGLNRWIDGFWKDFSETSKRNAADDPTKLNKFVREGSCSTLTACWIDKGTKGVNAEGGPVLHWLSYGDSHLCTFNGDGETLNLGLGYPQTLGAMASDPHLLNWKDLPNEKHLSCGRVVLSAPMTIVLASDGVGEFIHLRYLSEIHTRQAGGTNLSLHANGLITEFRQMLNAGSSKLADQARNHVQQPGDGFSREMDALLAALETEAGYVETIKKHHANGLLSNDDATLVIIEVSVEKSDSNDETEIIGDLFNYAGEP